ncbi:MAG: SGNH/GDSL hydrolase family protein [Armatimonadetes bacterium]|nr:SGNH/GDSL hydrolase family protein [Armatimonadota bacterium]
MSDFVFGHGQKVVFIGDSITDCGRRGEHAPFGTGYVKLAIDLITARYPERRIAFLNEGIGGNTVEDLRNRWSDDVLVHRPDWLSVKIGINDLHRTLAGAPTAVPPERFAALYREVLERARDAFAPRLILIDPFYMSTESDARSHRGRVLALLPEYLAVVRRFAEEFGAIHVRTHEAFQEQLRHRPADAFCPEPVHPNVSGHLVIAHALLRKLGW